jgi:hypothetical protein
VVANLPINNMANFREHIQNEIKMDEKFAAKAWSKVLTKAERSKISGLSLDHKDLVESGYTNSSLAKQLIKEGDNILDSHGGQEFEITTIEQGQFQVNNGAWFSRGYFEEVPIWYLKVPESKECPMCGNYFEEPEEKFCSLECLYEANKNFV